MGAGRWHRRGLIISWILPGRGIPRRRWCGFCPSETSRLKEKAGLFRRLQRTVHTDAVESLIAWLCPRSLVLLQRGASSLSTRGTLGVGPELDIHVGAAGGEGMELARLYCQPHKGLWGIHGDSTLPGAPRPWGGQVECRRCRARWD